MSRASSPMLHAAAVGAEVEGDVVHRHGADEREAPAADEQLGVVGQRAADPVAVADRHGGDHGVRLRPRSAARSPRSRRARRA